MCWPRALVADKGGAVKVGRDSLRRVSFGSGPKPGEIGGVKPRSGIEG